MQDDGTEVETAINEATALAACAASANLQKPKSGFRINGQKYRILRAMPHGSDPDECDIKTIYAKVKEGGCCMCVTKQCIIIGTWKDGSPGSCNAAVEALGKYLIGSGY